VVKVLSKTMDSTTLSPEKVELCTLSRDEATGKVGNWRQTLGHTPGGGELGGWGSVLLSVSGWVLACWTLSML
jgi:hypothetical protein